VTYAYFDCFSGISGDMTLGALVAANRIPGLEQYALERNAISYSMFVLFMLIPVFRFLKRPLQLFVSAMIAWVTSWAMAIK
jgi:hypothetical protein